MLGAEAEIEFGATFAVDPSMGGTIGALGAVGVVGAVAEVDVIEAVGAIGAVGVVGAADATLAGVTDVATLVCKLLCRPYFSFREDLIPLVCKARLRLAAL